LVFLRFAIFVNYFLFFTMNIYVGNLSWSMTNDDLYNLFAPFGDVISAKIVTDKFNNNRSKGFGFVEMDNDESARNAIEQLNDTEVQGRKIVVNESTPRAEGSGGGGYKKKSFGGGGGGYNKGRVGKREGGYNRY
jgi:RNA recognition motif-containing protein